MICWLRQPREERRNQHDADAEGDHDVQRCNHSKLDEHWAVREDEGGKTEGRRRVGQKRGVAHLGDHALKRHHLVAVALELRLVLVDEVNAIGHPNHNHKRRNQRHQQAHPEVKQRNAAQRPCHTHGNHSQTHPHDSQVPEEQKQQQRRHQNGCTDEIADFTLDLVGHADSDERQAAQVRVDAVRLRPSVRHLDDVLHNGAPLGGVQHAMVEHHHHQGGLIVWIVQEPVVKRQRPNLVHNLRCPLVTHGRGIRHAVRQFGGHRHQLKPFLHGVLGHFKRMGQSEHRVDDHRRLSIHHHPKGPHLFGELMPSKQSRPGAKLAVFHPNHQHVPFSPKRLQEARMRQFGRVVVGKDAAVLVLHL